MKGRQSAFRGKYERITRLSPYFHSVPFAVDPASEHVRLCQTERERERRREGGRERERERGGSYIGAFEVSRLLGIKSARPFTASSGCVAVSRLYPLQPAAVLVHPTPSHPLPVRRQRGVYTTIGARVFNETGGASR